MTLTLISAVFLAVSPLTADLQFSSSYHGDELPEHADPRWTVKGRPVEVTANDGVLSVKSAGPGMRHFYVIDQKSGSWNMESGLATVEFRMKCQSDAPEDEVFRVQLSDGKNIWRAAFYPRRCNGVRAETEDWDTYTLTVRDGRMQIVSEKLGVLGSELEPSPLEDDPALLFGTFKGSAESASRSWDLDFIRWSNEDL